MRGKGVNEKLKPWRSQRSLATSRGAEGRGAAVGRDGDGGRDPGGEGAEGDERQAQAAQGLLQAHGASAEVYGGED